MGGVALSAVKAAPLPDYTGATAVLYNSAVPQSKALAEFYAKARGIPEDSLIGLPVSPNETISRAEFETSIEAPLREAYTSRKWWVLADTPDGQAATANRKRILAVMSGVPMRVSEQMMPDAARDPKTGQPLPPAAGQQNCSSVDSELTLLGLFGHKIGAGINNPYFKRDEAFASSPLTMMLLVGRIDGPSFTVCERLIRDAIEVEKTGLWGRVYLDLARKGAGYDQGDAWILAAGKTLGTSGWPVEIDAHPQTLPTNYPLNDAAVYLGWYVRSPDGFMKNSEFRFRKGAVATHIHSYSAQTIRGEANEWCGPLLGKGAAAVLGNTWEPYLALTTHLDVYIDRLLKGYTAAEAAWMATPALSWMNVVLGDPLYRPFAKNDSSRPAGSNADFQLYHQLIGKFGGSENKDRLMKEVEAAATARKSGILWEALAVLTQTYYVDDLKRAAGYFEKAAQAYGRPSDKIRCYLQVPDMQRRNNQMAGAIMDLKRIISEFPQSPETEAARMWLNTLQPPPPPAPSPLKR